METSINRLKEALVAEINIERTPNSDRMDIVLTGKAGEILPGLFEKWA